MGTANFTVSGNIVDVAGKRIFRGSILVENGIIKKVSEGPAAGDHYILPGLSMPTSISRVPC